jgi:hypothetical protein
MNLQSTLLLLCSSILFDSSIAWDQTYYLVNVSGIDTLARCLDGSPYIFYVAPGRGVDASKVMIWLEGGELLCFLFILFLQLYQLPFSFFFPYFHSHFQYTHSITVITF